MAPEELQMGEETESSMYRSPADVYKRQVYGYGVHDLFIVIHH